MSSNRCGPGKEDTADVHSVLSLVCKVRCGIFKLLQRIALVGSSTKWSPDSMRGGNDKRPESKEAGKAFLCQG